MIELKPLDIVVFDGTGTLLHGVIEWRSLDSAVHCVVVADAAGTLYDPDFKGIKKTNLLDYAGRHASIHRYLITLDTHRLLAWCEATMSTATGYDYRQWLAGFVCGIRAKALADDPNKWTCAEFPYWMFQENGYDITPTDEVLPMPRFFRYSPLFTKIFEGVL